jgi:hypothetical protein
MDILTQDTYKNIKELSRPERRGAARRSVIDDAKAKVTVAELANRLATGGWRRAGGEWVSNCPLPDHEDSTPSFTVDPEQNVWFCHGCLRGGDVVELARFAWNYEKAAVAMAAAEVLREFGYEPPQRPASWIHKQDRQVPVRDAIAEVRISSARRRLYRWMFLPIIQAFVDPEERAEEAARIWADTEPIARGLWNSRTDRGRR